MWACLHMQEGTDERIYTGVLSSSGGFSLMCDLVKEKSLLLLYTKRFSPKEK